MPVGTNWIFRRGQRPINGKNFVLEDYEKISSYAVVPMNWAVENEIIRGVTEKTICPGKSASRGEIATIIKRFCKKVNQDLNN